MAEDSGRFTEWVEAKGKRPGRRKPYIETQAGDQLRWSDGDFVDKYRRIDRDGDWYDEVVTDDAGQVIHETHEPLTQHFNHGSAKPTP